MTLKGAIRKIRRNGQGLQASLAGIGTVTLSGTAFRSGPVKDFHFADVDRDHSDCYQAGREDSGEHYTKDPENFLTLSVRRVMQVSPGDFAELLGMPWQEVEALAA